MSHFRTLLELEANKAAEVRSINDEKKAVFIDGARWLADYIHRCTNHGPMAEAAGSGVIKYLDELALKDVKKALSTLLSRPTETASAATKEEGSTK